MHYQTDHLLQKHPSRINEMIYRDLKFYGLQYERTVNSICEVCFKNNPTVKKRNYCMTCKRKNRFVLKCKQDGHFGDINACYECRQ